MFGFFFVGRKRLNLEVLRLRELGELLRLETRWWVEKGRCGAATAQVLYFFILTHVFKFTSQNIVKEISLLDLVSWVIALDLSH